jgi:hypothetical protein
VRAFTRIRTHMRSPTPAEQYPFLGQQLPCFIGGEFVSSARSFPNTSPVDGRVIASVSEADAALVERAVAGTPHQP